MPIDRRAFLRSTLLATAAAPFVAPLGLARATGAGRRVEAPFQMLRRGVGVYTGGRGGTVGLLASPDALVVVDTQFADTAEAFWTALRAADGPAPGRDRLDVLVNTHHHGDHTGGNAVLARHAVRHVAHAAAHGLQRASAVQAGTLDRQALPREGVTVRWRVDVGGGETMALHPMDPAHTAGDLVVHFEAANVAHVGDLVFNRMVPFVDLAGGASTDSWIATLDRLYGALDDETIVVFGHGGTGFGPVGRRADVRVMRDFLAGLVATVTDAIAAGKTADELATMERLPAFPDHFSEARRTALPNALRAVYTERTRRPPAR